MLETTDGELVTIKELEGKRRNKYAAVRTWSELCGCEFASKAEARRGEELAMMERAGEIRKLEYQPRYVLSKDPSVTYVADFRYWQGHILIVEDVKGKDTPASRVKRAWLKEKYGITVKLITREGDRWKTTLPGE